jgi:Zn finger protein HypA/HybF involved in hydrogenase expression
LSLDTLKMDDKSNQLHTGNESILEENFQQRSTDFDNDNVEEAFENRDMKSEKNQEVNHQQSKIDQNHAIQRALRRNLTTEWKKLSLPEQMRLRAKRSKQGIKCSKCNLLGYYEEFCPNCTSNTSVSITNTESAISAIAVDSSIAKDELPTLINDDNFNYLSVLDNYSLEPSVIPEDSMSSVSSLVWNPPVQTHQENTFTTSSKKKYKNEIEELEAYLHPTTNTRLIPMSEGLYKPRHVKEMYKIRDYAIAEAAKLRECDRDIEMFTFLNSANEGYNRSYPELTLHQVIRYIIRLLYQKILDNKHICENDFHLSLFQTPKANRYSKGGTKVIDQKVRAIAAFSRNSFFKEIKIPSSAYSIIMINCGNFLSTEIIIHARSEFRKK